MWEQGHQFENGFVNALLTDWTVSGVHNWSSGNPLNFTMGTDVALDGTGGAGRQLAQLADGKTVDDISRDQSSREDMIAAFFDKSRVCAGSLAAARDLRQRAKERHQRAGDVEERHRRVAALYHSRTTGNAPAVPRRIVQRVQPGELRPAGHQRQRRPTSARLPPRATAILDESDRSR